MTHRYLTIGDVTCGLGLAKPVQHRQRVCGAVLVDVKPTPERQQETELDFWRRKAKERAKALYESERRRRVLELRILELLDEAES